MEGPVAQVSDWSFHCGYRGPMNFSMSTSMTLNRMRTAVLLLIVLNGSFDSSFLAAVQARDLHVDPEAGDDAHDGVAKPVKSISRAIRFAGAGDTIHLRPVVYRDYAGFYEKHGEPGRPITLEGHGATLDGADPLDPAEWKEVEPGLFRQDDLLRLDEAIIGRWFFLWDGRMNHMGRTSKGPSLPLKQPEELKPGEWTFVNDPTRQIEGSAQIFGAFYLRLPPGQKLAEAKISAPVRSAGVQFGGKNSHLTIRNLTTTHPYNDGFNIHGSCRDVVFENIRAIDCGDDGISAHDDCQYTVDGFVSTGNSTGICDTGDSVTSYNRVFIRDCLGFDLYFLDTGRYSLSNAVVLSSAARTFMVTGRDKAEPPCMLAMDNVYIRRERGENEVRVSTNSRVTARRVSLLNLMFQATGGEIELDHCFIGGTVPPADPPTDKTANRPGSKIDFLLWKDVTWRGQGNLYDVGSLRFDKTTFTPATFADFQRTTKSETDSAWRAVSVEQPIPNGIGADLSRLKEQGLEIEPRERR